MSRTSAVAKKCSWCNDKLTNPSYWLKRPGEAEYKEHCADCVIVALLDAVDTKKLFHIQ